MGRCFRLPQLCLFVGWLSLAQTVNAATFVVNTTGGGNDAAPGDGVCADAQGNCSLPAALQETNALPGADRIEVPAGTYTISNQYVTDGLELVGDGAGSTIIDGAGQLTSSDPLRWDGANRERQRRVRRGV